VAGKQRDVFHVRTQRSCEVKRARRLVGTVAAAGIAFGAYSSTAKAASATANLGVSATVTNNCTISTTALAFGSYDPVGANASGNLDGTGTVVVACTKGATATVGLGLGGNASGRTTIWSDSGAGLLSPAAAPSKAPRNFTVYGRVTGNQDVPAGNYSDTVVATVNF
jgi:spore coat protein U domain-containing protein, fimbrial subunit CupE1/2/3/6